MCVCERVRVRERGIQTSYCKRWAYSHYKSALHYQLAFIILTLRVFKHWNSYKLFVLLKVPEAVPRSLRRALSSPVTRLTTLETCVGGCGTKMLYPCLRVIIWWLLGALPGPLASLPTFETRWTAPVTKELAAWIFTCNRIFRTKCVFSGGGVLAIAPFKKATGSSPLHD